MKPIIDVYTFCWNEEIRLPYFLRLWNPIARTITIFDNGSSDNSENIAKSYSNAIWNTKDYDTGGVLHEPTLTSLKNNCWKKSRDADLVFVGDIDEILFYKNKTLQDFLSQTYNKFSLFQPNAYDIISTDTPKHQGMIYDHEDFKFGCPDEQYSKICLFSPKSIKEINYNHGCHKCKPEGDIKYYSSDDFYLLHYHWLNCDFAINRRIQVRKRYSDWAYKHQYKIKHGKKGRYFRGEEEIKSDYQRLFAERIKVI